MKKQNETLQSKVDELTIDNTRLRQDEYELERLRDLYKLDQNYSCLLYTSGKYFKATVFLYNIECPV